MSPTYKPVGGQAFRDQTVKLDGNWFSDCSFTNCTLHFEGLASFGYDKSCQFNGNRLVLSGPAELTIGSLAGFFGPDALSLIGHALLSRRDIVVN